MRLTGRSIFWTVVAAVFAVLFINMYMSLGPDARAMLVGGLAVAAFFTAPIGILSYSAGKRRDRREDEPAEPVSDLEAYWIVDSAVARLACSHRAAYEQGRDDARQIATDRAIAMLTSEEHT